MNWKSGEGERVGSASDNTISQRYRRMVSALNSPLVTAKGVGEKLAGKFARKGLRTYGDALSYLPIRHEDRTRPTPINRLTEGQQALFSGTLISMGVTNYHRRRVLEALVKDEGGNITLKWFRGKFDWLQKRYPVGAKVVVTGQVRFFRGVAEVHHPEMETLGPGEETGGLEGVVPIYSEVEGIHPRQLRKIMRQIVAAAVETVVNLVPDPALKVAGEDPNQWAQLGRIWGQLHFPSAGGEQLDAIVTRCRRIVVLEEFFFLQLGLLMKKEQAAGPAGIAFTPDFSLIKPLLETLPFELTGAQRRVLSTIRKDMERPHPMHRLLQGDVGCGKTLVALLSGLMAVESGYQCAIMAPTEVLAEQHLSTLTKTLTGVGARVELLTGSVTGEARLRVLAAISLGEADIVVGTHALIEECVEFANLGLVVVDEQHRFGVMQRGELTRKGKKGGTPDLLVMTATPIPRSLSMTVYGDLDLSIIDELPPGRTPVKTKLMRGERGRNSAYKLVRDEVEKGRQAYIVYPLVEESEKLDLRAATEMYEHFRADIFPDLTVGLLHGRMKGEDKERVLREFTAGSIQLLVCTTVIEVGIDVGNATVMVIEHAERFGLSQLHQLRGRVGRSGHKSFCCLSAVGRLGEDAYQRLKIMVDTEDGFVIAEEDLKIRGPGDMLGTRQSGVPDFRIGHIVCDGALLEIAREMAREILKDDPTLERPEHRYLREVMFARWAEKLSLVQSG